MSTIATGSGLPPGRSRLATLLEHFARIPDPRDVRRILHPLYEVLLLAVCATIADCDDYDAIADWDEVHVDFLRQHLPYTNGVPGGRWLIILMNRINPALFSAAFTAWMRQKATGLKDTAISQDRTVDIDHGRIETVINVIAQLQERHDRPGLRAVVMVMVESTHEIAGKVEQETRFYITSLVLLAQLLGPIIRSHEAIENNLHWVMNVIFHDDKY